MDTIDRADSNLPAPFAPSPALFPALPPQHSHELATAPQQQFNSRAIVRGFSRHWKPILLLWLVVSGAIIGVIHQFVEPTYEAASILRVEPAETALFSTQPGANLSESKTLLQTQANLITCESVLKDAVAKVANLPWIKQSDDPRFDIRTEMVVKILPDSYLIRVSLELPDPKQAAAIVRSVVAAYTEFHQDYKRGQNRTLRESLEKQQSVFATEIKQRKDELKDLHLKGNLALTAAKPELNKLGSAKGDDDKLEPIFSTLTKEHTESIIHDMVATDLELAKAKAAYQVMEAAFNATEGGKGDESQQDGTELESRIIEEFQKDPAIVSLAGEIKETQQMLDQLSRVIRQPGDPSKRDAKQQLTRLNDEYQQLWQQKYSEIRKRLQVATTVSQSATNLESLRMNVEKLQRQKEGFAKYYADVKSEDKEVAKDNFEATFLTADINSLQRKEDEVGKRLAQVDFENNLEHYRVVLVDEATAPKKPTSNKRIKYEIAAPVGVLFLVLGLFMLVEIKAERVADPDSLSTRVRSEVYALPKLPTPRSIRKLTATQAEDQIDQFMQRLDHLRFAVCGNSAELGKGRCVLISSAVGGEGKTTLAAQLALRCGDAGISTLLIDADLRRASLCPLLDVPEGPGLSDVLKGEAIAGEVVIPVQGGSVFLLRSGTPIPDTNRVLQGSNFGVLITELRQVYDLIIIDSPPILPVPDALILGRWADGAVLASRYDISRFSQVERARRQLNNAGIAILGTVINGMKNADSYYGRYSNKRQQPSQSNSTDTI